MYRIIHDDVAYFDFFHVREKRSQFEFVSLECPPEDKKLWIRTVRELIVRWYGSFDIQVMPNVLELLLLREEALHLLEVQIRVFYRLLED